MKIKISIGLVAIAVMFGWQAGAQTYDTNNEVVQTFAGSAFSGYLDGQGQLTMFNTPNAVVSDSQSNLFVWDSSNSRIRKIAPDSTVKTFAGGGNQTSGVGTNVNLSGLTLCSLAIDRNDTIWMLAGGGGGIFYLYEITSSATITNTKPSLFLNNSSDIPLFGLCLDSSGKIYISDPDANKIYNYTTNGVLSVFAGSGNVGYADGNGLFTAFNKPAALACDSANNIYVWDSWNYLIRRIDQSQNVTTLAGKYQNGSNLDGVSTNAAFNLIYQMSADNSGNIYLACGNSIRKMEATTNVVTMAGSFTQSGYTNGAGNLARFNGANGVCLSQGSIFVADSGNQRIRQISFNPQPQVVTGANLGIGTFAGITITGAVGRTYQIQSSPDLNTWTTRATLLLTSSPYLWIDQNPIAGNKFYQALMLP